MTTNAAGAVDQAVTTAPGGQVGRRGAGAGSWWQAPSLPPAGAPAPGSTSAVGRLRSVVVGWSPAHRHPGQSRADRRRHRKRPYDARGLGAVAVPGPARSPIGGVTAYGLRDSRCDVKQSLTLDWQP